MKTLVLRSKPVRFLCVSKATVRPPMTLGSSCSLREGAMVLEEMVRETAVGMRIGLDASGFGSQWCQILPREMAEEASMKSAQRLL